MRTQALLSFFALACGLSAGWLCDRREGPRGPTAAPCDCVLTGCCDCVTCDCPLFVLAQVSADEQTLDELKRSLDAEDKLPRPTPKDRETVWSAYLAQKMGGIAEFKLPDGSRVDIVTKTHAWEVEWVAKWEQSVGQCAFYSNATGLKPGVILLFKTGSDSEQDDWLRAVGTCAACRVRQEEIAVRTVDTRGPN